MKINIGISQISFSLPLFIARKRGMFTSKKLNIKWNDKYHEAETMCQDIATGKLDGAGYIALPIIFDTESKHAGTLNFSHPVFEDDNHLFAHLLVSKKSNINNISDLKGKRIGIFPTKAFKLWMESILEKEKIISPHTKLISILPENQQKALETGEIDALLTNDPTVTKIIKSGIGKSLNKTSLLQQYVKSTTLGFPIGGMVFNKSFIRKNPETIQSFYDVLSEAIDWTTKHIDEAKLLISEEKEWLIAKYIEELPVFLYINKPNSDEKTLLQSVTDEYYCKGLFSSPINSRLLLYEPYYSLDVNNLSYSYTSNEILKNISFSIKKEDFITIFGPNASGKSTLLGLLSGIKKIQKGSITIGNESLEKSNIAYVYQDYRQIIMPWKTVSENISFLLQKSLNKKQRMKEVSDLCRFLDIDLPLNAYPNELSGGQQQMIAILSALIEKPEILLLDEPFSALDFGNTLFFQEKLQEITKRLGLTIICISHDLDEAIRLGNKILLFSSKPTQIFTEIQNTANYPRDLKWIESNEFLNIKRKVIENSYLTRK